MTAANDVAVNNIVTCFNVRVWQWRRDAAGRMAIIDAKRFVAKIAILMSIRNAISSGVVTKAVNGGMKGVMTGIGDSGARMCSVMTNGGREGRQSYRL